MSPIGKSIRGTNLVHPEGQLTIAQFDKFGRFNTSEEENSNLRKIPTGDRNALADGESSVINEIADLILSNRDKSGIKSR